MSNFPFSFKHAHSRLRIRILIPITALVLSCGSSKSEEISLSVLYELFGEKESDGFGQSLAALGDLNSDGFVDFGVTAYAIPNYIRVISGREGLELYTVRSESADEGTRFRVTGDHASIGDLTGDGIPEFVLSDWRHDTQHVNAGIVSLVDGQSGSIFREHLGQSSGGLGWPPSTRSFGDIDLDGVPDYGSGGVSDALEFKKWCLFSGRSGLPILEILPGTFGAKGIVPLGDLNKDGHIDFAVTMLNSNWVAANLDDNYPEVWIISGALQGRHRCDRIPDDFILHVYEKEKRGYRFEGDMWNVGDLDNDGEPDFIHRIYVQSGRYSRTSAVSTKSWKELWNLRVAPRNISAIGDLDQDGIVDLAITSGGRDSGKLRVVSGSDGTELDTSNLRQFPFIGATVISLGDFDGDGFQEMAVSDTDTGKNRVRLLSFRGFSKGELTRDFKPAINLFIDDDQRIVSWPAIVDNPVIETSTSLIEWEPLFETAPTSYRFAIPEFFSGGDRFFRLRYTPFR